MKERILKTILVIMSILTLTMFDFILVGKNIVMANVTNVEFDAYLKNGEEKVYEKNAKISSAETLVLNVKVKDKGELNDGKIKIENANFRIQNSGIKNNHIKQINVETNEIELNPVVYENDVIIEIPIQFVKQESFGEDYFTKENSIKLTGTYKDTTEEPVGIEKKVKLNWTEDVEVELSQNIRKYLTVTGTGVLLQQTIKTQVKENKLPRENETIETVVPVIGEQKPKEIYVLLNGEKMPQANVQYTKETGKLLIKNVSTGKWGQEYNTYEVIHIYDETVGTGNATIELNTKSTTKLYTKENIVNAPTPIPTVEISATGNLVDIEKSATGELYKGYLYAKTSDETQFVENNKIQISNKNTVERIEIKREDEILSDGAETYSIPDYVVYKQTIIRKSDFDRIFGTTDGKITIKYGETEEIIDNTKQADENGNIVVNYSGEVTDITIETTAPVTEGEIIITNVKAIKSSVGFSKEILKTITKMITKTKVITNLGETIGQAEIRLNDTKTEAKLEISNTALSTLQPNENVQLLVTLLSNSAQYDLYKNPIVEIVLPEELKVNVKDIIQLNKQDEVQVIDQSDENNKQVIKLKLEGEQKTFVNDVREGIQVAITADITIDNTVPSKEVNVVMNYTNENRGNESFSTTVSVQLNSKDGALIVNRLTGYDSVGSAIESIDDSIRTINLEKQAEGRIVTQETYFINNYEGNMENVVIIGKVPGIEEGITNYEINLTEGIVAEGENIVVSYSEEANASKDSDTWRTDVEDITKVRTFKIELQDGVMEPGSVLKVTHKFTIPEGLGDNAKNYSEIVLDYNYNGNAASAMSTFELVTSEGTTEQEPGTGTENGGQEGGQEGEEPEEDNTIVEETEEMAIEIVAKSGGKELAQGANVYEGQGIKYIIKVTNKTNETLSDVRLEAVNTNAIYYNTITYEEDVYGTVVTKTKTVEDETLTSKVLEIKEIPAGETVEVKYQISVKEVTEENQKVTGTLKVNAEGIEEKSIDMIENNIITAKIKPTLLFGFSENVTTGANEGFPVEMYVKNISGQSLTDVIVELPVSDKLTFSTEYINEESEEYEFIEYKDGIAKFKILSLDVGEEKMVATQLIVKEMPLTETQTQIMQHFEVVHGEERYISNEFERTAYQTQTNLNAEMTTNIENGKVKDGDNVKYYIDIENTGEIETEIDIIDEVPDGIIVNSAKVISNGEESEIEVIYSTIYESIVIKPNDKVRIEIDGTVFEDMTNNTEINNYAEISGREIPEIKTNTITLSIEREIEVPTDPQNPQNPGNPEDPTNPGNPEDPTNPTDPTDPTNPTNPEEEETYSITGIAWVDSNENGMKDGRETRMSNIPVILIDEETGKIATDVDGKELQQNTTNEGTYEFTNVKKGKYIVIFKYDVNKYDVAEYQKEGISESMNSDVVSQKITLNGETIEVAATKTINVETESITNIDAGFVEGKIFDLSLRKYINRIIVQNGKGTKVYSYDKQSLTKIEIDAKLLSNTNVIIEYNIEVTNEGEIAGYANEVIDYMPKDLTFSSEMNKAWYQNTDGSISSKELSNTIINPGEAKSLTLTLTKKMTQNNVGTTINIAEIGQDSNDYKINDIDSVAGNKVEKEDDISKVETIISVRTGTVVMYISLIFTIFAIIGVGIYFINKKVLYKD